MNSSPITAFLPCREGSQRVKRKNVKTFAGINGGLTKIKIEQLVKCDEIDKIIVSTDDADVISICKEVLSNNKKPYEIIVRPKYLATSETSTDDLIKYVSEIITEGEILWTHVTSPFVTSEIYSEILKTYQKVKKEDQLDSLLTVTKHQKFFWDSNAQPINYNRDFEKWPRTQTMKELYEVNSAVFLSNIDSYKNLNDRVGKNPYMYELNNFQSLDIDWEEDFELAELVWLKKYESKIQLK